MSIENKKKLIKEAQKKLYNKVDNQQNFSGISYQPTLLIMAKVLDKSENIEFKNAKIQNDRISQFINNGNMINSSVIKTVLVISNKYNKSNL